MDLEKLTELAHEVARPWKITTYIFAFLLLISMLGNMYFATIENTITLESNVNDNETATDWSVSQDNGK